MTFTLLYCDCLTKFVYYCFRLWKPQNFHTSVIGLVGANFPAHFWLFVICYTRVVTREITWIDGKNNSYGFMNRYGAMKKNRLDSSIFFKNPPLILLFLLLLLLPVIIIVSIIIIIIIIIRPYKCNNQLSQAYSKMTITIQVNIFNRMSFAGDNTIKGLSTWNRNTTVLLASAMVVSRSSVVARASCCNTCNDSVGYSCATGGFQYRYLYFVNSNISDYVGIRKLLDVRTYLMDT